MTTPTPARKADRFPALNPPEPGTLISVPDSPNRRFPGVLIVLAIPVIFTAGMIAGLALALPQLMGW